MSRRGRSSRRKKTRQEEDEEKTVPSGLSKVSRLLSSLGSEDEALIHSLNQSSSSSSASSSHQIGSTDKNVNLGHTRLTMESDLVTTVQSDPLKGTCVVARKDLPAGTTVLEEAAFAWQPLEDYVTTVCHHCMAELPRWAVACGESGGSCNMVGYCSTRCRERAASVHRIEHKAFLHARDIAAESRADVTLIRLATRIVALQYMTPVLMNAKLEQLTIVLIPLRAQNEAKRVKFEKGVMSMVGHEDIYAKEWLDSITEAAKGMLSHIPKESRLSTRDFVKICSRINTNSHRLHHLLVPQRVLGVGLYPLASLMNHSCQPNCGFYNRGALFIVRTLRDVKAGEELCYSYIDLYQSRAKRKAELLKTKFFNCSCDRCSEPIETSTDRFLSGFLCPNHKNEKHPCDGLLILPEDVCPEREAVCTAGCGQRRPEGELVKTLKRVEIMLSASQSLYYDQKRTSDAKTMLDKLLVACNSDELQLHPLHPALFQAHVDSINVSDALGYTRTSLDHCAEVLRCAEVVLPPNHLETSNYYYYLGMLYAELLAKHQGEQSASTKSESKEEEQRKKQLEDQRPEREQEKADVVEDARKAREAFGRCLQMRSVWFGPDHPCVLKARDKMEAI